MALTESLGAGHPGRHDVRGTLLRSVSSLCTIASGGSICREGAMVCNWPPRPGSWVGRPRTHLASFMSAGSGKDLTN